jgi:hypothetical protein
MPCAVLSIFRAVAEVKRAPLELNHKHTFLPSFTGGGKVAITFGSVLCTACPSYKFSISSTVSAFEVTDFRTDAYRLSILLTFVIIRVRWEDEREVGAHPFPCFTKPKAMDIN